MPTTEEAIPRLILTVTDREKFLLNVACENMDDLPLDYVLNMLAQAQRALEGEYRALEQQRNFHRMQRSVLDQAAAMRVVAGGRS